MESEKVKEIKKGLKFMMGLVLSNKLPYIDGNTPKQIAYEEIFNYINELESENERLRKDNELLRNAKVVYETVDYCYEGLKKAEKRIAELEKGNEALSFAIKQGFNDCQTKTLKQFAERLKEKMFENEKGYIEFLSGENAVAVDIVDFENCLEETLKDFI